LQTGATLIGQLRETYDSKTPWGRGLRGCAPDTADPRDVVHTATDAQLANLPPAIDLRPNCPPIYDQGALESCTSHAIGAAIEYNQRQSGEVSFQPSRLFIYYNERQMEGLQRVDNGAMIRDGIKTVVRLGAPPEEMWPYDVTFVNQEPPAAAFAAAKPNLVTGYSRVPQELDRLKAALAEGFPIVICIATFPSIDHTWDTGFIPLPQPSEQSDGGHCILLIGYNDASQTFLVRNSWGTSWGESGYGTISYEYITTDGLTSDFWTIRSVKGQAAKPDAPAADSTLPPMRAGGRAD
jgi:C1A family cysteine protease